MQQLHLAEDKLREVKQDFDELFDPSGPPSRIYKNPQIDVFMDMEPPQGSEGRDHHFSF